MAFELKDDTYFLGMWTARIVRPEGHFLAMIFKEHDDGLWHLKMRFRYYVDDKAFDSADKRVWKEWKSKTGEQCEADHMKGILDRILELGGKAQEVTDVTFIPCHCNGRAMGKIISNPERPGFQWAHMTEEQERQYDETGKLPAGVKVEGDI
jgi:hypothetical protein